MRTFAPPTRIRIADKPLVEKRIQFSIQRMMQQPVADSSFVDVTRLWVGDFESVVCTVFICFVFQTLVEFKYIVHK